MTVNERIGMVKRALNNSFHRRQLLLSSIIGPIQKRIRGADGVYITDADWDNLIILDGCRFDLFNQVRAKLSLDGELTKRQSRGSASPEFLQANFSDRTITDTVYVTANPFEKWVLDEPFLSTDRVWTDGWDETEETVLPKTLAARTRAAHEEYPHKRLIAHFMQPHVPFVGETRVDIHSDNMEEFRNMMLGSDGDGEFALPVWNALSTGQLEPELVWEAYRDNLLCVLETVLPLAEDLPGKTVITADHGNSFGEWASPFPIPVYFHPRNVRIPSLTEVPWFVPPYDERKSIVRPDENITPTSPTTTTSQPAADTPTQPTEDTAQPADESVVEDRLSALGYTE